MHGSKTKSRLNSILVTGVGGPAGKCAASYLLAKGCTVIGTDMRTVCSNVSHFIEVPSAADKDFMPAMLKIVRDFDVSLLVPTVSEELPIFASEASAFTKLNCHVAISPYQAVDIANDKLKTALFLERQGIAVPRTLPSGIPLTNVADSIDLPIIAKPRISRGGRGVVVHTHHDTLFREKRSNIVFQEFMSGEEYDVNLFVDHKGKLRSCVVLHKTGLREGLVGNATGVERVKREDIVDLCSHAVKALGIVGPADIDVRDDAAGNPHLLEINARLGANALSASEVMDDLVSDWKESMRLVEGIR